MAKPEKIVVLDFGGQYNQLIARRVRESGVYCEILNYAVPIEQWRDESLRGIILTGGPNSVYAEGAPRMKEEILHLGVPVLGICYGMQLINDLCGGRVESAEVREYGHTMLCVTDSALFRGVQPETAVFMNHGDRVSVLPKGFTADASTANCPIAAFSDAARGLYGVQFHPEVRHSVEGTTMLRNFVFGVCGCRGGYRAEDTIERMIAEIRRAGRLRQGRRGSVRRRGQLRGLRASPAAPSSPISSPACSWITACCAKTRRRRSCRPIASHLGLNVIHVDASERFLEALKGVTDPERKRKIIGELFVRVFEEEARKTGADFLLQGTIYPDKHRERHGRFGHHQEPPQRGRPAQGFPVRQGAHHRAASAAVQGRGSRRGRGAGHSPRHGLAPAVPRPGSGRARYR